MNAKLIIVLVLAVLIGVVIAQNTSVVTFRLLFWQLSMSQIVLLLLATLLGFLMGFFMAKWRRPPGIEE
jgi:uncharacterized integral membrane protein